MAKVMKVSGDNMTGALTIGPDGGPAVTTLDTNGAGSFNGNVTLNNSVLNIDSSRNNTTFKHINIENSVLGDPNIQGGSVFSVLASGTIRIHQNLLLGGDQNTGSSNVELSGSDGSASFAGDICPAMIRQKATSMHA